MKLAGILRSFRSSEATTAGERAVAGLSRLAGLAPEARGLAEHLTRLDRREQVKRVRALYTDMRRSDAKAGVLLLHGDEEAAPAEFARRLSLLDYENPEPDALFPGPDDDFEDWPRRDDLLSSLDCFDPIDIRDKSATLRKWLADRCECESSAPQDLFDAVGRTRRLCILAFKVSREDTMDARVCLARHVDHMVGYANRTPNRDARFLFVYWLIADPKSKRKLEALTACQNFQWDRRDLPHQRIEDWGQIEYDHFRDWRNAMKPRLDRAGAGVSAALDEALLSLYAQQDSVPFREAVRHVRRSLHAAQNGGTTA